MGFLNHRPPLLEPALAFECQPDQALRDTGRVGARGRTFQQRKCLSRAPL
jgi:hypothetical protein